MELRERVIHFVMKSRQSAEVLPNDVFEIVVQCLEFGFLAHVQVKTYVSIIYVCVGVCPDIYVEPFWILSKAMKVGRR